MNTAKKMMEPLVLQKHTTRKKEYPYANGKKSPTIWRKTSPFFLLSLSLVILFPYAVITSESIVSAKLIIYPFLIVNIALADFAIWNYLRGRNQLLAWLTEMAISAAILYWLLI